LFTANRILKAANNSAKLCAVHRSSAIN
jgi:hypothetical protein